MVLPTPERIRTLQRKLYAKAKQEPAYRLYALYDKLYRADILSHAWRLVKANRGSPGVDGISFEAIESGEGIETCLRELAQDLKDKTYRAQPVRRLRIPKADGSLRPLGIPTIRDRVAQMAVKLIIEPIFEADFCAHSYGFRPKKSAHAAVDDIADTLWAGYPWGDENSLRLRMAGDPVFVPCAQTVSAPARLPPRARALPGYALSGRLCLPAAARAAAEPPALCGPRNKSRTSRHEKNSPRIANFHQPRLPLSHRRRPVEIL
ncbi:MAG: hypothetical protein HY268_07440 [Deltaproteobacteria bacterium]|nr:hypothetical protein [Deltaproteobacteria bacterium]